MELVPRLVSCVLNLLSLLLGLGGVFGMCVGAFTVLFLFIYFFAKIGFAIVGFHVGGPDDFQSALKVLIIGLAIFLASIAAICFASWVLSLHH